MNATVKTVSKWLILMALLGIAIGLSVWSQAEARTERCQGIEVEVIGTRGGIAGAEDSVVKAGVMQDILLLDPTITKRPARTVNTRDIELFLKRFGNFETVECVMTSQGRLRVVVEPIVPELRVFDGDQSYYVNREGKRIPATAEFYREVPVVAGHFSEDFQPQQLIPVARYIAQDTLLKHLFPMLWARDEYNIMAVPCIKGHIVNLGDTTMLDTKFRNLLAMYRQVLPERGWELYDTISVKYRGRIVATRRDKKPVAHAIDYPDQPDPEELALQTLIPAEAYAPEQNNTPSTPSQP